MRLTSQDMPERNFREIVHEVYNQTVFRSDLEPQKGVPFRFDIKLYGLPDLGVAAASLSDCRTYHRTEHISGDDLIFNLTLQGGRSISQRGQELTLQAGEAVLASADPVVTTMASSKFLSFRLPRARLAPMLTSLDSCLIQAIRPNIGALRLLPSYIGAIDEAANAPREAQELVVSHVYDLIVLTLGANRDATEIAAGRGVRAARLRAIRQDIIANLGDTGLSLATVARRHGVSPRYVGMLFDDSLTIMSSGSFLYISSGGVESNGTLLNGASGIVLDGGKDKGITVSSGGREEIWGGGSALGTVVSSGGSQTVSNGGSAVNATLIGGSEYVLFGGLTSGTIVSNGGQELVELGGTTSGTNVSAGGFQVVYSGGQANGTIVSNGGQELVESAGTAGGTTVSSGGFQVVYSGGQASGTIVSNGGQDLVESGGIAGGATISNGGYQIVSSGGQASGTTVSNGGHELVSSGGSASGAALVGGTLEILSGGMAGTSLITISSGTLILDDSVHFSGTVAGLANSTQQVDLADIAFATASVQSYTTNGSNGGTVAITDGLHTAQLNVLGTYTALNFKLATDGAGGTILTDPPVSSGNSVAPPH